MQGAHACKVPTLSEGAESSHKLHLVTAATLVLALLAQILAQR